MAKVAAFAAPAAPAALAALAAMSGTPPAALAGDAAVVGATIQALGEGRFRIDATVAHDDTGWEHYADRWDVLDADGTVLGTRELAHPHENEQPFTRSLTLSIPADVPSVTIRAGDSVHGDEGGETVQLDVPH